MCQNQQGEGTACYGRGRSDAERQQQISAVRGSLYHEFFHEESGLGISLVGKLCRSPAGERTEEGRMVAAVLKCFFAGNAFELQQEIIASYIGMEYKEQKKDIF